jgi:hypothetical protein
MVERADGSVPPSSREYRLGLNEALLRNVNERIEAVGGAFTLHNEPLDFLCECAELGCPERVRLRRSDYRRVRDDPTWFVVVDGHQQPEVERVVGRLGSYLIVEKVEPDAAAAARALA